MTRKLGPALIKTTNLRLKVAKRKIQKKQEVVEKRKAEAADAKRQKDRGSISLSNKDANNY